MITEKIHTEKIQWHKAIPEKFNSANQVHIWRVFPDTVILPIEELQRMLSVDELERAGRFHFEKDQLNFIMARAILRMILSHYLDDRPHKLHFDYNSFGKPMLLTKHDSDPVNFNLSHSNGIALYAITRDRNVGIDVEQVRDGVDVHQVSERFFSAGEIGSLKNISKKDQLERFFQYWTRKEAIIKAIGKGVSFPLEQVDISTGDGRLLSSINLKSDGSEDLPWHVMDLVPGDGYKAAIAIDGDVPEISCWDYSL